MFISTYFSLVYSECPVCRYFFLCLQYTPHFHHWVVLQSTFIDFFTTDRDCFRFLIIATVCFRTQSNHFSASEFFLEKTRCSLIMFLVDYPTVSREEVERSIGFEFSITAVIRSARMSEQLHLGFDNILDIFFSYCHI